MSMKLSYLFGKLEAAREVLHTIADGKGLVEIEKKASEKIETLSSKIFDEINLENKSETEILVQIIPGRNSLRIMNVKVMD